MQDQQFGTADKSSHKGVIPLDIKTEVKIWQDGWQV